MSFSERDLQNKLDEMEAELNQNQASDSQNATKSVFPQVEINPSPQVQGWIDNSKKWFQSLPKFGKVAVAVGGVWLGFSILGAVLHVVSSILSIAAIGLVLYVGYRLFSSKSNTH
ncbi:MAG: hypothetical protein AAGF83_00735 [Cyanobacteria bacterium P01_G01_bin.67]